MFNFGTQGGMTPPIRPQEQQVIDPRAMYERQSILADTLLGNAQQYQGGGALGALAMIANAFAANKVGERAQGSLSAALEQEQEAARAAAEAEAAKERESFQRDLKKIAFQQQQEAVNRAPPATLQMLEAAGVEPRSPQGMEIIMSSLRGGGPTVNVNSGPQGPQVGTIPQGFQLAQDPETGAYRMEAIPGGPAEIEQQSDEQKARDLQTTREIYSSAALGDIDRVLQAVEENPNMVAGVGGYISRIWPGSQADDVQGMLETIKTTVALDRLDVMRKNSPTGGAVGQFTEGERTAFEKVLGDLEQTRSPEMLARNLKRVNNSVLDIVHGTSEQRAELVRQGKVSPEVNAEIEAMYKPLGEQQPAQGQPAPADDEEALIRKYL